MMRRILLLAMLVMGFASVMPESVDANTWYVDNTKSGDGSSWGSAFGDLKYALDLARSKGDTVKVWGGQTFKPTNDTTRNKSFWLDDGAVILGAFIDIAGNRDVVNSRTILSGDIGVEGVGSDNSYNVLRTNGKVVIDGFIIENGMGVNDTGDYFRGAGLMVYRDSTVMRNCTLRKNKCWQGGAIAVDGANSGVSLIIENCLIDSNYATGEGGAIFAACGAIQIVETSFNNNSSAGLGGAVAFYGKSVTFSGIHCSANTAGSYGGSLYLRVRYASIGDSSTFENNEAGLDNGGGVYVECDSLYLDRSFFDNNRAGHSGGALCFLGKHLIMSGTEFTQNNANKGGAAYLFQDVGFGCDQSNCFFSSSMDVTNARFIDNTANGDSSTGGAISWLGRGTITNSNFQNNSANSGGAFNGWFNQQGDSIHFRSGDVSRETSALYDVYDRWVQAEIDSSHITRLINCTFTENSANTGSAINGFNGTLFGCYFGGNRADNSATVAGFDSTHGNDTMSISNCTFSNNTTAGADSALVKECRGAITNSIFYENVGDSLLNCSMPTYSIIQNWTGGGTGNSNLNPLFIGDSLLPIRLSRNSPAIDAGDPAFSAADTIGLAYTDIAGSIRLRKGRIDIGACEAHNGRIYVDSRAIGNNTGASWSHAFRNVQDAIHAAETGDSIWVAEGTYYPKTDSAQYSKFSIKKRNNVAFIGGFKGNETTIDQRKPTTGLSVLSGDIGITGDTSDNAYCVIGIDSSHSITFDGFKLTNATRGAVYGGKITGKTVFNNCTFQNNYSWGEGAATNLSYCDSVQFIRCDIHNNVNDYYYEGGGAVFLYGVVSAEIIDCKFYGNAGTGSSSIFSNAITLNSCTNSKIINTTICSPGSNNAKCALYQSRGNLNIINSIFDNPGHTGKEILLTDGAICIITNTLVRGGVDSIAVLDSSSLASGFSIFNFDPLFTDADNGNLTLAYNSPCIDHGAVADTTGWSKDLAGNPRIYNDAIDLGAYEFQGIVLPNPPTLLSTLANFEVPAGGSLTIDLARKNSDSSGYYVRYPFRTIEELTWVVTPHDTAVHVTLDPDQNILTIAIGPSLRPGAVFSVRMRAADPVYTAIGAEKEVNFKVVSAGFEICALSVMQNDTGRDFKGVIDVKRTIDSMVLSGGRVYLGDAVNATPDKMQYLSGITVNEMYRPISRGGDVECGRYAFSIDPSALFVYNNNGVSTGKTLIEWAVDSTSRWPGSVLYKKNKKIRFVLPVTNGIDGVQYRMIDVPAAFDGPFTRLLVSETYPHRQKVIWSPFSEPLKRLELYVYPGFECLPADTVIYYDSLHLTTIVQWIDSLQDSQNYLYRLLAEDLRGNITETRVERSTPSGLYAIRGEIKRYNVPKDTTVHVQLYRENKGVYQLDADTIVAIDSAFMFGKVTNGNYRIYVECAEHYYALPEAIDTTLFRDSIKNVIFNITPEPVISSDAMYVEQLPGSGDLQFYVRTSELFYSEYPKEMLLRWEGGEQIVAIDSQIVPVKAESLQVDSVLVNGVMATTWRFVVTRETIADSILNNGKQGFDVNVRYLNSVLYTAAPDLGYSAFRSARWTYPVIRDEQQILFAAQRFKSLSVPEVTNPLIGYKKALLRVNSKNTGPNVQTEVAFIPIGGGATVSRSCYVGNYTKGKATIKDQYTRHFNVNGVYNYSTLHDGRAFLSGILIDTANTDSMIATCGSFTCYDTGWQKGSPSQTLPVASWKFDIAEEGWYWMWVFLDKPPIKNTEVYMALGDSLFGKKYRFVIKAGTKSGWQPVWTSGSEHDAFFTKEPYLQSGSLNAHLFMPSETISISACVLKKKSSFGETRKVLPESVKNSVPSWGSALQVGEVYVDSLVPDTYYRMMVSLRDLFGNVSDTVVIDSIKTRDNYFQNRIIVAEEPVNGNLAIDLDITDTNVVFIDSVIFRFSGVDYRISLQQSVTSVNPQHIVLSREKLDSLTLQDAFKRHTVYDSLFFVFSAGYAYNDTMINSYSCTDAFSCASACDGGLTDICQYTVTSQKRSLFSRIQKDFKTKTIISRTCTHTHVETMYDTVRTGRIPASWPKGTGCEVASQEYRIPPAPVFDTVKVTSRTVKLASTALNEDTSGNSIEQMAGVVQVTSRPGSLCADSTVVSLPFGNRFAVSGGWIAFMPSFEGALSTTTGILRAVDTLKARHQWIDRYTPDDSVSGGEFYPNIGFSVSNSNIAVALVDIPSVSTGIILGAAEASLDTISADQRFYRWVLPSKNNSASSRYFYWGLDGKVDTVVAGDAFGDTSAWIQNGYVYLPEGRHSIDLFMKDDGVGIAGIALSKNAMPPAFTRMQLARWGESGFACSLTVGDLPSASEVVFSFKTIDRFGNSSGPVIKKVITKVNDAKIPDVVITPSQSLENGYYHSVYPAFLLQPSIAANDSLLLETRLIWNHAGTADSVSLLDVSIIDTLAHVWIAEVDSGFPLSEWPDSGAVTSANGYALQARIISVQGDTGNWSQLLFGVVADTGEVPPSVTLLDPLYTIPALAFRFDHGIATASHTIIGDLEVVFDSTVKTDGTKLMVEGATIYTDTLIDSTGTVIYEQITGFTGGTIRGYTCSEYYGECSSSPVFRLYNGRYQVEIPSDSITLDTAGLYRLSTHGAVIYDDNNSGNGLSGTMYPGGVVKMSYFGITDTCYANEGRFYLKNVLSANSSTDGFSLNGCRIMFARDTAADSYTVIAAGGCDSCGPDLVYTVLDPRYLDSVFSVFDKLDKPVVLSYTEAEMAYSIVFGGGANQVSASNCKDVRYTGWNISLDRYTFDGTGVHLDDFSVVLPEPKFPAGKNADEGVIHHFKGVRIAGDTAINSGALHLSGTALADMAGAGLTTENDYKFINIDTLYFVPEGYSGYVLRTIDTCTLEIPAGSSKDFDDGTNVLVTVHAADSGLTIKSDNIASVYASGPFVRHCGTLYSDTGSKVETFTLCGLLSVSFAANDFQLKVLPDSVNPLFMLHKDFFVGQDVNVAIPQGSIGLFSDFTINTLYAKKEDGNFTIKPPELPLYAGIPSQGFDIFKTDGDGPAGIRVLLLAPEISMGNFDSLMNNSDKSADGNKCEFVPSIYNAGFDLNGKLTNISARIDLPDDILSCFGAKGMGNITDQIAQFKLKTLYLGMVRKDDGNALTVGADATITLGKLFNSIGLQGEKILLEKMTAENYHGEWKLSEMHAKAFQLPRKIGIGPKNYSDSSKTKADAETGTTGLAIDPRAQLENDRKTGVNYIELYTGGKGFQLDYEKDTLDLTLRNWSLRTTDAFPIKNLSGISFMLDSLVYEKVTVEGESHGRIRTLGARGSYTPPDGRLSFGDVHLCGVEVTLGCDKIESDVENTTNVNAYLGLSLDSLQIGEKTYKLQDGTPECQTAFKVYFDGTVAGSGCLVWEDTIGIVPWGDTLNPRIFIDPGTGTKLSFRFDSRKGFDFKIRNVALKSRDTIPVIDTMLNIKLDSLAFEYDSQKKNIALTTLDVSWFIYKKIMENDGFRLAINKVQFGYNTNQSIWKDTSGNVESLRKKFWIITEPDFTFKLSDACETVDVHPVIGLINDIDASREKQNEMKFIWRVDGNFGCKVAGFGFGANFKINSDTVGFETAYLEMNDLEEYGMIKNTADAANGSSEVVKEANKINIGPTNFTAGVKFKNAYWIKGKSWDDWKFTTDTSDATGFKVIPTFEFDQPFEICGFGIKGTFNFERLFKQVPGIGYRNVRLMMKGTEIPTGVSLLIDGNKPYVHAEYDQPSVFRLPIPKIELTESFTLGEALLEFGTEKVPGVDYDIWYAKGKASMSLKPALENLLVDIEFQKPQPWENVTGIRHAKVSLKLSEKCRIPLGTTPFYITGFEGALYDGNGMPAAALACNIPKLDPGLKVEAAMFLEFESPSVANGKLGFWVHLRKFNLGINGEVEALEGIADASACAAIYNNGQAFHGQFNTIVNLGLSAKGRFTVDMWNDQAGGNFTTEAMASIGLNKGSLVNKFLLKIPPKTMWFVDLFSRAGKFDNNKNGLTTGVKFIGKTWGVGVINSSFKIGDMGKYRLKQPPLLVAAPLGAPKKKVRVTLPGETEITSTTTLNPGFELEGGEVISIIAASDSASYQWPENVLLVRDPLSGNIDLDDSHYASLEAEGADSGDPQLYRLENMLGRVWINEDDLDSISIYIPDTVRSSNPVHGGFEYLFSVGLKPPVINISAKTVYVGDTLKVEYNGTVTDFQGTYRTMRRKTESGYDTLFRRKMDLQFITACQTPTPSDTVYAEHYLSNHLPIPIDQFEGYTAGEASLIDSNHVTYEPSTRTLTINNLVWNTAKSAPGIFALCAAVVQTDLVVEDENGKKVLPDSAEADAVVYRENPVVLPDSGTTDTVVVIIDNNVPLTPPTGFTVTGSAADANWAGADETRSLFLRWDISKNPSLNGYQISWRPASDTASANIRTATIGNTDHFTIEIPSLDTLFTDDCDSAKGKMALTYNEDLLIRSYWIDTDSGLVKHTFCDTVRTVQTSTVTRQNRLCPETFPNSGFYKATSFDVTITPIYDSLVIEDNEENRFSGPGRRGPYLKTNLCPEFARTITNVPLGSNAGANVNSWKIVFKPDSQYVDSNGNYNGQPIAVPLNVGTTVPVEVVTYNSAADSNPSRFGELWASVEDTAVDSRALPRAGTFNNYFTVNKTDDTIITSLSLRPIATTQRCKELYANSCQKVPVDSNGVEGDSSTVFESCGGGCRQEVNCSDCDPGYAHNELGQNDPCNGNPDREVYKRTPFGLYTARLYAINNGQRAMPVAGTVPGPVVYDSLLFSVTPPKPILHDVQPGYILASRNDTLRFAVSNLWIDSTAQLRPAVRISWVDSSGVLHVADSLIDPTEIRPMQVSPNNPDWQKETPADYEVVLYTAGIMLAGNDSITMKVCIVNRDVAYSGDTMQTISNSMLINFVRQPDSCECPNHYYDADLPDAPFVMDYIGNYPRVPSPGCSLYVRFTELHDLDPSHFTVNVVHKTALGWTDTTGIPDFRVRYEGIAFVLPETLNAEGGKTYKVIVNLLSSSPVNNCENMDWGKNDSISFVPERLYAIHPEAHGFSIVCTVGKEYRSFDNVSYFIGSNSYASELPEIPYVDEGEPTVIMAHSDWVTAIITDWDKNNRRKLKEWINIEVMPELVKTDGTVLPAAFTAEPGDTVLIRSPRAALRETNGSVPFHCYEFDGDMQVCNSDMIIFTPAMHGRLTVERHVATQPGQVYGYQEILEGMRTYTVTLRKYTESEMTPIAIPSGRLLDAVDSRVYGYPLLLRLDTTTVPTLGALLRGGFHFRNSAQQPIPCDVEQIDTVNNKAVVWVKVDTIDPGIVNNTIYIAQGSKPTLPTAVWSDRYRAVWHCSVDSIIGDATGNKHTLTPCTATPGLITSSVQLSDTAAVSEVSGSPVAYANATGISLSAWVKADCIPFIGVPIITFTGSGSKQLIRLSLTADSALCFIYGEDTLQSRRGAIEEGVWLHVAATFNKYDSVPGTAVLYVNGLPVAKKFMMNNNEMVEDRGGHVSIGGNGFNGLIDEVRVAAAARSGKEIALDYVTQWQRNDFLTPISGISAVTAVSAPGFRLLPDARNDDFIAEGSRLWQLKTLPPDMLGMTLMRMPWNDRFATDDTLCTVAINGPATIHVLFDRSAEPAPFLDTSFTADGRSVLVVDSSGATDSMVVYTKHTSAAATFTLGGPASGGNGGNGLPYVVIIDGNYGSTFKCAASPWPHVKTATAKSGALLYSDREDVIDSLPPELAGGVLVRTANAWRFNDSAHCVSLVPNRNATVSLLLDTLAKSWPSFMVNDTTWKSTGLMVTTNRNCYSVVSKPITGTTPFEAAGVRSGKAGGNRAGYAFIVKSDTAKSPIRGRFELTVLDTGALPYVDSLWYIKYINMPKNGLLLLRNRQAEYANATDAQFVDTIDRAMKLYCAIDGNQIIPPKFINDTVGGRWEPEPYSIGTSIGGTYAIYSKFYRTAGTYTFAGARSGGDVDNVYNYFFLADTTVVTAGITIVPPDLVIKVDSLKQPFIGEPVLIDTTQPVYNIIKGFVMIRDSLQSVDCRHLQFGVDKPGRIWLCVDPAFVTNGTFIEHEGWTKTTYTIAMSSGDLSDRIVWWKEFLPGVIDIPGPQCDFPQPGVYNPIVIIEFFDAPYTGLYAKELAVRGFGDERSTESENFKLRNLDIVYSWDLGLRSRSWIANITTRSAQATSDDTLRVLTPFETDVIYSTGDTVVTRVKDRYSLADLMPVLIEADSVQVNAVDLTAQGSVRIAFKNHSDIAVNKDFMVLLYEDRNHDFHWTPGVDRSFGHIIKHGVAPNEYKVYRIGINDTIQFPNQTFFAFIDANNSVTELNEWNNVISGGSACDGVVPETWLEPIDTAGNVGTWGNADSLYAGLPAMADSVLFCYLQDTDGDNLVTYNDSLAILYVYANRLHAVNAITNDSLFTSVGVSATDGFNVRLDDYSGNGAPEIVAGSRIFTAAGVLIADFAPSVCTAAPVLPSRFDFNSDADPDVVGFDEVDSCITIRSGRDSTLLFVYPFSRYTGGTDPFTTGALSNVAYGARHCYNVNLSFPRYSQVSGDTADLTVRVSSTGNDQIGSGTDITVYADTVTERTLPPGGTAAHVPTGLLSIGTVQVVPIDADRYEDIRLTTTIPPATKRIWFMVDGENRYFESRENDNVIVFGVE